MTTEVTPNSALLLGYIVGALHGVKDPYVRVVDIGTEEGVLIIESTVSQNRFAVTVAELLEPKP